VPESEKKNASPVDFGRYIENNFITTNHNEIIDIINKNIQLAEFDEQEMQVVNKYVSYVTIYNAIIHSTDRFRYNPVDLKAPFPNDFPILIKTKLKKFQEDYNKQLIISKTS
jgi:hypothetical protein